MIANNLINKLQNKKCKFLKKNYLTQGFRRFQDHLSSFKYQLELIHDATNFDNK